MNVNIIEDGGKGIMPALRKPKHSHCSSSGDSDEQTKAANIWMPVYIGDFFADTAGWSAMEVGAYILLTAAYWRAGSLPNDEDFLRRISRLTPRQFKAVWSRLLQFFTLQNELLKHPKLDKERESWTRKKAINEQRAKRAATERWRTKNDAPSNAQALPTPCPSPSPSPSPIPNKSLSTPQAAGRRNRRRESVDDVIEDTVRRGIAPIEEVLRLCQEHANRLNKLPSGAYQTAENFRTFIEGKLSKQTEAKPKMRPLQRAHKERERWWKEWIQDTHSNVAKSWEEARDMERAQFMSTKYGANYRALAEGSVGIQVGELGELEMLS